MSGAFNIDIEVGSADGGKIKIYCASLTDTWTVEKSSNELVSFRSSLSKDATVIKNKIGLGPSPSISDLTSCELFLSRLGCTAAILRIKLFQDFLNIPSSVRDGLTYASHKSFGKNLREGYMQKHPRFVRRGGGKKWIRLTNDDRGASLICYKDENKNAIISSIKISASTEIQNLKGKGIPNAFVVKSGKRQWVLQASSTRDYQIWQNQLANMLKQFGNTVSGGVSEADEKKEAVASAVNVNVNQSVDKSKQQNLLLKQELDALHAQIEGMTKELDRLKVLVAEAGTDNEAMIKKVELEFKLERDALIRDYDLQSQNLEDELQEIKRQIDAKTAMDSGNTASLLQGFHIGTEEVLKSEIDTEKQILDTFTEDERATIKFLHKHLHRHRHKHIHTHKHIHLHKDEADNVDNVDIEDVELVDRHTIAHTITHTNSQFQIKKAFF